jgi:hypothetical protein
MTYQRYAIYWIPPSGSVLEQFGRSWLGGDLETGEMHDRRIGLGEELAERAAKSPRRYGFHATIKAPFRLASDVTEDDLAEALALFCSKRRLIRSGPLGLERFPSYLALCPQNRRSEIEWLASDCVANFDRFRAPLTDADRKRRRGELPPLEKLQMEQFGYPYIFSLFYFHISLAGPLEPRELDAVAAALRPALRGFANEDFLLGELCLVGDPGDGALFKMISRAPLMR